MCACICIYTVVMHVFVCVCVCICVNIYKCYDITHTHVHSYTPRPIVNLAYTIFCSLTLSTGCSYEENLRDAKFYTHVIVFTPFAATVMGLASICLLALYQYYQRRKMVKIVAFSDQSSVGNIQISESKGISVNVWHAIIIKAPTRVLLGVC